jgi:hypothetical protein
MNRPRLNCYYIDLQLFIRTKHQIPKNEDKNPLDVEL